MNIVFVSIIEALLYHIGVLSICVNLLNAKISKVRTVISFMLFVPLTIIALVCQSDIAIIAQEIFQIIDILIIWLCLKNIKIHSVISTYLFLFLINIIIISNIDSAFFVQDAYEKYLEFVVNIISSVLCIIICNTNIKIKVKQVINLTPKNVKRLFLSIIFCCAILSTLIVNDYLYIGNINSIIAIRILFIILIILLSLALPTLMIYSMTNKHFKDLTENYEKQINAQSEYYILLSKSNFELRRFRHDYKNMCIGLSKLISENQNDEALEMLKNQNLALTSSLTQFDTGNGIADALLTDKQKQADKINTKIKFDGAVPNNTIKPTDLCIIFGNTIDNALEACQSIEQSKTKTIYISCECNSGFMFIKISNPIKQKVKIDGNKPLTTKADKALHGFGLNSLEKAVKQYNGTISYECTDDCFQVNIDLELII